VSFRVLIAGGRHFTNYPALRAALDVRLANRLPEVVLLTAGGRGVPMLAASYAAANGLEVVVRVADFGRFSTDADERRDAFLVSEADAAVVVRDGSNAARSVPSPPGACGSAPADNAVHRQSIGREPC
jgi:hypothetical protein